MYKPKTVFSSNWDLIAPRVIDARAHKVPNIAISLGVINFQRNSVQLDRFRNVTPPLTLPIQSPNSLTAPIFKNDCAALS